MPDRIETPPPYPGDTRAKGWRFEVDMEKVKASDTWLRARRGAVRGALLLLWSEAWQQTPCGTLPNDDELVSLLIDMEPEEFARHRSILMRGWWLAEDGRLYHDTITDRVQAMLAKRAKDAGRAANRRAKAVDERPTPPDITAESRVTTEKSRVTEDESRVTRGDAAMAHPESSTPSTKHQADSTGEEKKTARKRAPAAQVVSLAEMVEQGVDPRHAADWLTVRKAKRSPLTPTAWDETKAEALKAGISIGEAIRLAVSAGWAGFRAKWIHEPGGKAPPSRASPADNAAKNAEAERLLFGNTHHDTETIDAPT